MGALFGRWVSRAVFASAALLTVTAATGQTVLRVNANLASGANDGSSWDNAFRGRLALQAALAAIPPGQPAEIWVTAGQYAPAAANGDRNATFTLRNGVSLLGGFAGTESSATQRNPAANPTILTGDLNSNDAPGALPTADNSHHVVKADGVDATAVLDGFTVRHGSAAQQGVADVIDTPNGGGILVLSGTPTIRNCIITRCITANIGAGVAVLGGAPTFIACTLRTNQTQQFGAGAGVIGTAAPLFDSCLFESNVGGNGAGLFNGTPFTGPQYTAAAHLVNCIFRNNLGNISVGQGPGIFDRAGNLLVENCRFERNLTGSGGGGVFLENSHARIRNSRFFANTGNFDGGDAAYIIDGSPTFEGCIFWGHAVQNPPAFGVNSTIFITGGTPTFVECTFANNNEPLHGHGVLRAAAGTTTLTGCIFWGNQSQQGNGFVAAFATANVVARHCCIQGWAGQLPGEGNFASDPLFVQSAGPDALRGTADDDFHLLAASPCIDRGDNNALAANFAIDADGSLRRRNAPATADTGIGTEPIVDIGAFEFQPAPICVGDLNDDRAIDLTDLATLLANFGANGATWYSGDLDDDGAVTLSDLALLLTQFGASCS